MDKFPKFIIQGDSLILSKVTYHKDLVVPENGEVKGGGWFRYLNSTDTFVFYGRSEDFGPAKLEDIEKCVKDGKVYSNIYKTHPMKDQANFAYDTETEIIELK